MKITIKQVAQSAGVSTSTVSKVINKSPEISEKTIKLVEGVIKNLNYIPNKKAQELAGKKSKNIGFFAKFSKDLAFLNPHIFEIMTGAEFYLSKKGYNFMIFSINGEEEDLAKVENLISNSSLDGGIIHASALSKKLDKLIIKNKFPHVVIGMPNWNSELCKIDNDNHISGSMIAKHLVSIGRTKIAFIGGEKYDCICETRWKGVCDYLEKKSLRIPEKMHFRGQSTIEDGEYMANQLIKSGEEFDAIICANNAIALGVMSKLKEKNLSIPENVAVVSFDKYPFSMMTNPPLTVVDLDVYDLGVKASKLLIDKIKNPNLHFSTFSTLPTLVARKSSNCPEVNGTKKS